MKFYKNSDGFFILGNDIVTSNRFYKLVFSEDDTIIALYYENEIILNGLLTDVQKENGTNYIDRADFLDGVGDFFVNATDAILSGLTKPYIHVIRNSTLSINNDTDLLFDTLLHGREMSLVNGNILFEKSGLYQVDFSCYINITAVTTIILWVDKSIDNGITWTAVGKMVKTLIKTDGSNYIPISDMFDINEGDIYKAKISSSAGTTSLVTQNETVSTGTVYQYAADFQIIKVSEL